MQALSCLAHSHVHTLTLCYECRGSVRGGARGSMDPPEFGTFRDLISEKGDFVILVTLLWTPRNENPNGASETQYVILPLDIVLLLIQVTVIFEHILQFY